MKKNYTALYENAFKKFTLGIFYIVFFSYTLTILFYDLPYPLVYFLLVGATLNITLIIITHYIPVSYVKKSIKSYLIIVLILAHLISVTSLLKGIVTTLFWYVVIPMYIYTIFPFKKALRWTIISLLLMLHTFAVTFILQCIIYENAPIDYPSMSLFQMLLPEMINASLSFLTVVYSLYYTYYFHRLEVEELENTTESTNDKKSILMTQENDEDEKYEKIYEQIIEYIEDKEPYLNFNFKITQMGYDLDINVAYLTKAIRKNKNMNFNNLINYYRIERAKELIQNTTSKYTLEYIYMSSGFNSQSSFNRAFKQQMNITPSQYYKQIANIE